MSARPPSRTGLRRVYTRAAEVPSAPDPDAIVDAAAIGPNAAAPIVVPQDWPGFGADVHFHASADSLRPDGWIMPPMQPAGAIEPYFFDGNSGAYPWGEFGFGFGRKNPDQYLERLGTATSAIDAVANVLSSMPVYVHEADRPVPNPPMWTSNPQPGTYESWVDFFKVLVVELLQGETFIWATARSSSTGYPSRFVILNRSWMSVSTDGQGRRQYRLGDDLLNPDDVLHLRYLHAPGDLRGTGPLAWMARSIVGARVLAEYVENVAQYGVPAILHAPNQLNARQSAEMKAKWLAARSRAGEPAVLSGGITYESGNGITPEALAAVDMIHTTEAKIVSAICQTPPYLVGVDQPGGSMTYGSLHQLTSSWWRIGLRPLAQRIMSAMGQWLLPHGTAMELNRDEFIRSADPAQTAQYYATMASIQDEYGYPALTVNEIRVAERYEPHTESAAPGSRPDIPTPDRFSDSLDLTGGRTT